MQDLPIKIDTVNNEFVVTEVASGKVICKVPSITMLVRCVIGLETYYGGDNA